MRTQLLGSAAVVNDNRSRNTPVQTLQARPVARTPSTLHATKIAIYIAFKAISNKEIRLKIYLLYLQTSFTDPPKNPSDYKRDNQAK